MVEVQFDDKVFQMPECWQECSMEQIKVLATFTQVPKDAVGRAEQEFIVEKLLGCGAEFWEELTLEIQQWHQLLKITGFVTDSRIEHFPFAIKHKDIELFVFQEGFADTDAVDLAWANMQYLAFVNPENPNLEALDELIATLCRPKRKDLKAFKESKDWDGDVREPYNGQRVKARAKQLKDLSFGLKIAILQYFEAQNRVFLEHYSQMLGNDGREPRYDNGMGWVTMLMSVAEKGTFGNFESVCFQNVHLIWAKCLDETLEAKEQEKLMEAERFRNS